MKSNGKGHSLAWMRKRIKEAMNDTRAIRDEANYNLCRLDSLYREYEDLTTPLLEEKADGDK